MTPADAAAAIQARAPGVTPRVGLVLGSGLGALVDELADPVHIPYADIPGFRVGTVSGHAGALSLGTLDGTPVACFQGRSHVYEGIEASAVTTPVRTLRLLGAEILVLTNAAGSLRAEVGPGSLMLISDHINLSGVNVLIGPNDDEIGPRFPSMRDAYDPELRAGLRAAAEELGTTLAEGVYLAVSGPTFETPAEIRAHAALGAHAVGMSTVHETAVARHCGLRVAAISAISNFAEGLSDTELSHEQTLRDAQRAAEDLAPLLVRFVERLGQ